jgi:hypothetical protein
VKAYLSFLKEEKLKELFLHLSCIVDAPPK